MKNPQHVKKLKYHCKKDCVRYSAKSNEKFIDDCR